MDFGQSLKKVDLDLSLVAAADNVAHFAEGAEQLHITYGMGLHFAMNQNFVIAADLGKPVKSDDGGMGVYIGMNWLF